MIAHCKQHDIPGAIISIDQAKAFDTISHKYMHQVYKFFGFGNNFIKLLETLGNGRNACIALKTVRIHLPLILSVDEHKVTRPPQQNITWASKF
jgi:hypothetical protein